MSGILSNPLIGPLIKTSNVRMYAKGQTIVYPGDNNSYLYLIKNGAVAMENIDRAGNRKVLHIIGAASLFPMVSFLDKGVSSSWFYAALVDTEVYVISYHELTEKLKEVDGFTAYNTILRQILEEVHELLLHISDHAKTESTDKLISIMLFLLANHTKAASNPWRPVLFPVTHQLLADMTGLTRETVTLTLKDLAKRKLIRYPEKGKLELNDNNLQKEKHS